jgi:hypothetical protein
MLLQSLQNMLLWHKHFALIFNTGIKNAEFDAKLQSVKELWKTLLKKRAANFSKVLKDENINIFYVDSCFMENISPFFVTDPK